MDRLRSIFLLLSPLVFSDLAKVHGIKCPDTPLDAPVSVPANTENVPLERNDRNTLCILAQEIVDKETGEKTLISAGRSYRWRNWESVGGKYSGLQFRCGDKSTVCQVDTPALSGPNESFQLYTIPLSKLTETEEVSRFLQQSTFGPTRQMLGDWNFDQGVERSFATWIKDQIDNQDATLHRPFFRSRAVGRFPLEPQNSRVRAIGRPQNPCDHNSRWRKYAFTAGDHNEELLVEGDGPYTLSINGHVRTEVSRVVTEGIKRGAGKYRLCYVKPYVGGYLSISNGGKCLRVDGGNPTIKFSKVPEMTLNFNAKQLEQLTDDGGEVRLIENALKEQICDGVHLSGPDSSIFGYAGRQEWYIFDQRVVLEENTVEKPIPDGGGKTEDFAGAFCSNVAPTFLNQDMCEWSTDLSTCGPTEFMDIEVQLDQDNIRKLYKLTDRFVYAISNLPATGSPCQAGIGRWRRLPDGTKCDKKISHAKTRQNLGRSIRWANDKNSLVRDIWIPTKYDKNYVCVSGKWEAGRRVEVTEGGSTSCWEHSHPDYYNVYDFTYWSTRSGHPGNNIAENQGKPNPIKNFAWKSEAILDFPGAAKSHSVDRWENNKNKFGDPIGKLGDVGSFSDFPSELRTPKVAEEFGAFGESPTGNGVLVCGSPGEVNNKGTEEPEFDVAIQEFDSKREHQRKTIFLLIALRAADQLRQRVAHALSQVLVISPSAFNVLQETECWVTYYDILVRNAFGNYRTILKEVSYSPMMAEMLSFLNSRSMQYILDTRFQRGVYPDENYAREIMQLFTIGTKKLNDDGSPALDTQGKEVATYTNEDVKDGARAWTGFAQQEPRGNIEAQWGRDNRVDPMRILPERRDRFPKMLFGKYVGDGYPLCVDMPQRQFLKKGATYRLLGSFPTPQMQRENSDGSNNDAIQMILQQNSKLFGALCNKDGTGKCNYLNKVILTENLECQGDECNVDTVRVVKVGENAFYEYVRLPCVQMPFYNDGKKTKKSSEFGVQCADPRLAAASEACCEQGKNAANRSCQYTGERMTFDKSQDRCSVIGRRTCDFAWFPDESCPCCNNNLNFWTDVSCNTHAKVNENGKVAIVHDTLGRNTRPSLQKDLSANVRQDTDNWFRVHWKNDNYEELVSSCEENSCQRLEDGSCMCPTVVVEEPVFTEAPTDKDKIVTNCHIAAYDITSFQQGAFKKHAGLRINGKWVRVWVDPNGSPYDKNTVFELFHHGRRIFLKNMLSKVKLQTKGGTFEFRNAPHFLTLLDDVDLRDAVDETEAVLDIYFNHQNTAPFVSQRMIQRFGFSNPSPRYMKVVTTAFRRGKYVWNGKSGTMTYGSGQYGDLSAVVAAILLDNEPRDSALDTDVSYGALREPLLKVIHFLRAMEFEPDLESFRLEDMRRKMGQMAHEIPTVFSNFLPDNSPTGQFFDSSLYAPEATLLNTPNVIGLLSGLFSLVKFGLVNCNDGFGGEGNKWICPNLKEGDFSAATGQLTFKPTSTDANSVADELNLLLAAGRMGNDSLAVIGEAYKARMAVGDRDKTDGALRVAQQLFVASPEFNTNTIYRGTRKNRPSPEGAKPSGKPYKAVVYVFLDGGCDSYNMLVPMCEPLRQEYTDARGSVGMKNGQLLPINAKNTQRCNQFGVHQKLTFLQESYNKNEALFFANAGFLFEDVTLSDWEEKTPTQLFAHDVQQREVQQTDAFQESAGTGVLGRMNDALTKQGFNTASISVADDATSLLSKDDETPTIDFVNPWTGVNRFDSKPSSSHVRQGILDLNNITSSDGAAFSELWGSKLVEALRQNEAFADALEDVDEPKGFPDSHIGRQFMNAARLMNTRDKRGKDREAYFLKQGGYDTHDDINGRLPDLFEELNDALRSFKEEMDKQDLWDQVTVVVVSEFARTLTPNSSEGTDHGWGGNYALLGGDLKANILGKYPERIADLDVERGRLIPTTPVDSCLNGVMQWMGVTEENMDKVLPNRNNFKKAPYTRNDLYR